MSDLLPCPFCGGNAKVVKLMSVEGNFLTGVSIECFHCGVKSKIHRNGAASVNIAIAAWNRRAPSAATLKLDLTVAEKGSRDE